jgi:biopolymer transport protein ExbD
MRKHSQAAEEAEVDITPMLDIVFIMLIFFIVTASFVKEAGIDVNRPDSQTSVPSDKESILILIKQSGEVTMQRRQVDPRAVRANVERLTAENPEAAVVIQADKAAKIGVTTQVIDSVRQAGVRDYVVATSKE